MVKVTVSFSEQTLHFRYFKIAKLELRVTHKQLTPIFSMITTARLLW